MQREKYLDQIRVNIEYEAGTGGGKAAKGSFGIGFEYKTMKTRPQEARQLKQNCGSILNKHWIRNYHQGSAWIILVQVCVGIEKEVTRRMGEACRGAACSRFNKKQARNDHMYIHIYIYIFIYIYIYTSSCLFLVFVQHVFFCEKSCRRLNLQVGPPERRFYFSRSPTLGFALDW